MHLLIIGITGEPVTKKPLSGIAPIKKAAKPLPYEPSPHGEGGPRQRWIGCFRKQRKCASLFPVLPICLSYHSHPIRPCGAPSLRGEGCDTRLPSSKKAAHHPCEPIRSPSTVIPSAAEGSLLHCRHMHTCTLTQTTPWCFLFRLSLTHGLPVCRKDPSTSVGMTSGRRVISHSLSHRFVDPSCAFGAPLL